MNRSSKSSFTRPFPGAQQNSNGTQSGNSPNNGSGIKRILEFLTPEQIRKYQIPFNHCLIGDYHICRGDYVVLAGPPGVGKSRAAIAAAVCGAGVSPWFNLPVHRRFKTLVFQSENGMVRLLQEFKEIGDCVNDCMLVLKAPKMGLSFDDPLFCRDARDGIVSFKPDLIIVDPWNSVAAGDKIRDFRAAFQHVQAVIPDDQNPAAFIVAHTRKPRPDERPSGRALLNIVSGSHLLGSVPRCVFVLQHASDNVDEDRVVLTCCKNNNGQLGPRGAWKRTAGVFDEIQGFDWKEFDSLKHPKGAKPWRDIPNILREIGPCTSAALVDDLIRRFGIEKSAAYNWIKRASEKRLIVMDSVKNLWEPAPCS